MASDIEIGPNDNIFELAFDLGKSMMVNAILVAQDQWTGYSNAHLN